MSLSLLIYRHFQEETGSGGRGPSAQPSPFDSKGISDATVHRLRADSKMCPESWRTSGTRSSTISSLARQAVVRTAEVALRKDAELVEAACRHRVPDQHFEQRRGGNLPLRCNPLGRGLASERVLSGLSGGRLKRQPDQEPDQGKCTERRYGFIE